MGKTIININISYFELDVIRKAPIKLIDIIE